MCIRDRPKLERLVVTKSWWDTVDILDRVVESLVANHPELEEVILKWSLSDNIWLRRVAIDHQLLRKEKTNVQLMEKILLNNLDQTEFFINKAIGWALRDYSKTCLLYTSWMLVPMSRSSVRRKIWIIYLKSLVNVIA